VANAKKKLIPVRAHDCVGVIADIVVEEKGLDRRLVDVVDYFHCKLK
jgi:hypothetical protein